MRERGHGGEHFIMDHEPSKQELEAMKTKDSDGPRN